jgi:APA family basic amino acid/polyamine antiporter
MLFVSLFAAFVPGRIVGEMTSIGTLFAFILVSAGVLVMRYKMPDAPRAFRVPLVPYIPILGILVCLFMMVFLPFDTWIRLLVWMLIGLDVYAAYGLKKSVLNAENKQMKDKTILSISGLVLAGLLLILANLHHFMVKEGEQDLVFYYVSMTIGIGHVLYFAFKYMKDKKAAY